jgi:hypothetical protein
MEGKLPEDFGEVELTPPDWLPDGWVMEVKRGEDGTLYQVRTLSQSYARCLDLVILASRNI